MTEILALLKDSNLGVTTIPENSKFSKPFSGVVAVECLVKNAKAHLSAKQEAINICQQLCNMGFMLPVNNKPGFKDNKDLYIIQVVV